MTISFDIPHDIERQLRIEGTDFNGKAREAFLLELYREAKISQAQLCEALGLSFNEAETLIKTRGSGQDIDLDEFEEGREFLRKSR